MTITAPHPPSRRIAVFGSVASERQPVPDRDLTLSPAARAVLERVLEEIASSAPSIARPILDRAVLQGAITRSERHVMLAHLSDPLDCDDAAADASQGARRALREALAAVRQAAPAIARPILDEAVDDERLTPAQERRILERLGSSPARILRGALRGPGSVRPLPLA